MTLFGPNVVAWRDAGNGLSAAVYVFGEASMLFRNAAPIRGLILATASFLLFCSGADAASLNIRGDLQAQGDGALSAGSITANGDATVKGQMTVQGDATINGKGVLSNDMQVGKNLNLKRFFRSYTLSYSSTAGEKSKNMGAWDTCFLSSVTIGGIDDGSSNVASCQITVPEGLQAARPTWTLRIKSGDDKVDSVACTATCLSFTTTATGAAP